MTVISFFDAFDKFLTFISQIFFWEKHVFCNDFFITEDERVERRHKRDQRMWKVDSSCKKWSEIGIFRSIPTHGTYLFLSFREMVLTILSWGSRSVITWFNRFSYFREVQFFSYLNEISVKCHDTDFWSHVSYMIDWLFTSSSGSNRWRQSSYYWNLWLFTRQLFLSITLRSIL